MFLTFLDGFTDMHCHVFTQAIGATFAAMIGAGMLVRSISYEHSPVPKHLAWMLHAGLHLCVLQKDHFTESWFHVTLDV